ncbi:DJ-1/PfpI family protein [Streptomyces sp. NPDC002018]|uniref:DJ-1/PfpI family protein n=1 Tax=Streptomyces sp. NPDC002018 TaxID=3364629 RepID=UPI0036B56191
MPDEDGRQRLGTFTEARVTPQCVRGLTSWLSIRTGPASAPDLCNAGAEVVAEQEVVVDGQLVTSRGPADLPAFRAAVVEQFARAHHPMPG